MSYKLRYTITSEIGKFEKEDASEDQGLCDAFIFVSILGGKGEGSSTAIVGRDAREEGFPHISDAEIFKAWIMIAHHLSESKDLGPGRTKFCKDVFEIARQVILSAKKRDPK